VKTGRRVRQVICTVKYADDLVLLAKEEAVLQGVTERLMEIGRCYGMEMNVEKNAMRIAKLFPIQIMIDKNNWRMSITSTISEA
jgi:hypothetical protein